MKKRNYRLQAAAALSIAMLILSGCSGGQSSSGGAASGGSGATIGAPAETTEKDAKENDQSDSELKETEKAQETAGEKETETAGTEKDSGKDAETEANAAGEEGTGAEGSGEEEKGNASGSGKTKPADDGTVRLIPISVRQNSYYDTTEIPEIGASVNCEGLYSQLELDKDAAAAYPELAKAIEGFNRKVEADYDEAWTKVLAESTIGIESQQEMGQLNSWEDVEWLNFYTRSAVQVLRADSRVVSIADRSESYLGGPHGYAACYPVNFDTETGSVITVDDIFSDRKTLENALRNKLYELYSKDELSFLDDYLESVGSGEGWQSNDYNFAILGEGVLFYFNPYDIAPYASGSQYVFFHYGDDADIFSENAAKYMETPDSYLEPLEPGITYLMDVDGNDSTDMIKFMIEPQYNAEYDYSWDSYAVEVNYAYNELSDIDGYSIAPYLVKNDGKTYFWLFTTGDNDYEIAYTYEMRKNHAFLVDFDNLGISYEYTYGDNYSEDIYVPANDPANIRLDSRMNALGTFTGTRSYHAGSNGAPAPNEEWYEIRTDLDLNVTAPFDGERVTTGGSNAAAASGNGKTGSGAGGSAAGTYHVRPGDRLRIVRTDNQSSIEALVNGKDLVRFDYDNSSYPNLLNGKDEMTLFENLPYVG